MIIRSFFIMLKYKKFITFFKYDEEEARVIYLFNFLILYYNEKEIKSWIMFNIISKEI